MKNIQWYNTASKHFEKAADDIRQIHLEVYESLRDFSGTNKYALPIWVHTPKMTLADILVQQHMERYQRPLTPKDCYIVGIDPAWRRLNWFQKLMNKWFGFYKEKAVELTIMKKEGESWIQVFENKVKDKMQKDADYMFGLTHYDIMYRATGDEKYLEEQQKYIRDNKK